MIKVKDKIIEKTRPYHFELKHLIVLFVILILFQVLISFIYKSSLQGFIIKAQKSYQQDFAERSANLTATSLEMLLESTLEQQVSEQNTPK